MIIAKAILKINPNAVVTVRGGNIDTCEIEWLENTTPIPLADIQAQIPIVEQEIANEEDNRIAKKEEAKAKLIELGLTTEHLKALGL